jgi:hypothetical protein
VISLAVAAASWHEANIANKLNEEQIRVVIHPNTDAGVSVGTPTCMGPVVSIPLTWRIFVFNNSAQPVTIESAEYLGYSNYGMVKLIGGFDHDSSTDQQLPITIAARASATFLATVPINAPRTYATWYRASGLCGNHSLDVRKIASQAGFTATGGSVGHPSRAGVAVSFKSSDGHVAESQAYWDDPISSFGPNIILPAQEN